jgi:hypothetical protein
MSGTRIVLFGLWVALMLTYLLGDVLRILSGHFTPGNIQGVAITQAMGLGFAVIMFIPIEMDDSAPKSRLAAIWQDPARSVPGLLCTLVPQPRSRRSSHRHRIEEPGPLPARALAFATRRCSI